LSKSTQQLRTNSVTAVAAQRRCIQKCSFFLPRGEKLVWRILFLHFISSIFYHQSFAFIRLKNQRLPLVGWSKNVSASNIVIF
jgi:hypothetical protein